MPPVYASKGRVNVIYAGYDWSYVQSRTSGVSGIIVKKFRTISEPFSSGWYAAAAVQNVKVEKANTWVDIPGDDWMTAVATSEFRPGSSTMIEPPVKRLDATFQKEQSPRPAASLSIQCPKEVPSTKDSTKLATQCPSTFYGVPLTAIVTKAKSCECEVCFKFLQEHIDCPTKDYLLYYNGAKEELERSGRARKPSTGTNTHDVPDYVAFTDGGATPSSGGPGGWGCLLFNRSTMHVYARSYKATTNNRMELRGILCALLNVPEGSTIHIYSDSQYAINSCSVWLPKWKVKGLLCPKSNAKKDIVETTPLNKDLLCWIYSAMQARTVLFFHVRGHSGNQLNDFVDSLCHLGRQKKAVEYEDVYQ